jgi:hypothetical protein
VLPVVFKTHSMISESCAQDDRSTASVIPLIERILVKPESLPSGIQVYEWYVEAFNKVRETMKSEPVTKQG